MGGRVQEKKAVDVDKIIQKTRVVKSSTQSLQREVRPKGGQNSVFMRTSALAILEPNTNQLPDPWGIKFKVG